MEAQPISPTPRGRASWNTWRRAFAALALASVMGVGCGSPAQLPLDFRVPENDIAGAVPITQSIMLVADNQQQYLYGKPVWIRTALVDRFVASAIRAPQLDLFGPSVLEWIVKTYGSQFPLVHLGDGLNLSCAQEFDAFSRTMNVAQQGWFMAPGNHDGIYFGSSGANGEWLAVCDDGKGTDKRFNKARFVQGYMDNALTPRAGVTLDPGVGEFAAYRQKLPKPKSGEAPVRRWDYRGSTRSWLRRVAFRVDLKDHYKSFITQELDVTLPDPQNPYTARYILLDTSDYEHSPELIPVPPHVNAGSTGSLSEGQLEVVESWLADIQSAAADGVPPVIVLMGHHPFDVLTKKSREGLERLRREYRVLLYVSAHTHKGDYFVHGTGETSWLELNVGSTVDWPLEYREFAVNRYDDAEGTRRFYTQATLNEIELASTPPNLQCLPEWQPQLDEPDYYVNYVKALGLDERQMGKLVFDSLLQSYKRLFRFFPTPPDNTAWAGMTARDHQGVLDLISAALNQPATDAGLNAKRALLVSLEEFDRTRKVSVPASTPPATSPAPSSPTPSVATPGVEAAPAPPAPTPPAAASVDPRKRHLQYRMCQALWASMDDETGARRARRKDWFVSFPAKYAK